jgi:hypothetical protein
MFIAVGHDLFWFFYIFSCEVVATSLHVHRMVIAWSGVKGHRMVIAWAGVKGHVC